MTHMQSTTWAQERFGGAADSLGAAVIMAIRRAHELALAAHAASSLKTNDVYGSTLHVTQHEQLVEFARDILGVSVRKPADVTSRFAFVVLDAPPVVLYPWRYATDRNKPREDAKFRQPVSDLRRTLHTIAARKVDPQLTLEQGALDPDQLEAEFAEEQAVLEQLASLGRVVTVGYASNPSSGLFDLGWGDMELTDEATGAVSWYHWEPLVQGQEIGGVGTPATPGKPPGDPGQFGRFDDAPLNDDFGLTPRSPLAEPPTSEPKASPSVTGSDEPV